MFCPECGGEVYEGERLYRFSSGREEYICGSCLIKAVCQLQPEEIAWLAGIKNIRVTFPPINRTQGRKEGEVR